MDKCDQCVLECATCAKKKENGYCLACIDAKMIQTISMDNVSG
jgi:hypothetical protein